MQTSVVTPAFITEMIQIPAVVSHQTEIRLFINRCLHSTCNHILQFRRHLELIAAGMMDEINVIVLLVLNNSLVTFIQRITCDLIYGPSASWIRP